MTDPKAQADAIDPRVTVWPPDIADCIAASDTLRAQQSRIEELESAAALAGKIAIEQAAKVVEENQQTFSSVGDDNGRHLTLRSSGNRDGLAYATAIRALSPTLDRNALIERGAGAMLAELKSRDCKIKHADGVWLSDIVHGDLSRLARAVLSAWIGEETK